LDFESPRIHAVLATNQFFGVVRTSDALPGWTVDIGKEIASPWVLYEGMALSSVSATLWDNNTFPPSQVFQGRFFFGMTAGMDGSFIPDQPPPQLGSSSIYQVGDIPADTKSLQFVGYIYKPQYFRVSLNGVGVRVFELGREQGGVRYGADAAPWAGTSAELRFTVDPDPVDPLNAATLDSISFSPVALKIVPEPGTWVLLSYGVGALLWQTRSGPLTAIAAARPAQTSARASGS
jgi:hypothetical protein